MLTNESARLKGHAIALQYILLIDVTGGGNYINPRAVLPICELRSAVIHGAKRRVASGIHYDALREVCLATFEAIMRVVAAHSELRSVKQLVDLLESKPDRIESVPQWVLGDQRTDRDLLKFAAKIAAERRERTTEIASREER